MKEKVLLAEILIGEISSEYIKDHKVISANKLRNEVELTVFVSLIENISEYKAIEEFKEDEQP